MGKKRKIFILSALAAGIAIFFGRKRMRSKADDAASEGDWTPEEDAAEDTAPSDSSASADAEGSAAEEDSEEESEEKAG